jgi:hypothetical protein
MTVEPFIILSGTHAGEIYWGRATDKALECFGGEYFAREIQAYQPYADFEREKLREIVQDVFALCLVGCDGYKLTVPKRSGWWGEPR